MDTVAEIYQACFDFSSPVVFFPVRHHSPACSFHLKKTMEEYRPDLVLIEGPADTNELIAHIGNRENQAPLCIYYSFRHKGGGGADSFRSACYYPLLDFSPELVAIRQAAENEVPCRFIDLPYSQLALEEKQRQSEDQPLSEGDGKKPSYYDDYHMARSRYIEALCEKQGVRGYNELWEKLFEIQGLSMKTSQFVESLLALCHFSRVEYPQEMLAEEGCLKREAYMAQEIKVAAKSHQRILVVTGGFHSAALRRLIEMEIGPQKAAGGAESFLIPYSFSESDQLSGYASGMPYPAFYQKVFENICEEDAAPYNSAVLFLLAKIGGRLRKQKETISIADESAACAQAQGLAALRGKGQQGVYELLDGVLSAYVKGPMDHAASRVFDAAEGILRGDRLGSVAAGVQQVPLLLDFQAQCSKHRLAVGRAVRNEVILDILAKPKHRQASVFFHRLEFLAVGFASLKAGPKYREKDAERVREIWSYLYNARVEAALIDVSYLGGTVREAASAMLRKRRQAGSGSGEHTQLLIDAVVMDLTEHTGALLSETETAIVQDGVFFSLVEGARNLLFLENAKWLLNVHETSFLATLLGQVYTKSTALLPAISAGSEEEDAEIAKSLKDLYYVSLREDMEAGLLQEALSDLCGRSDPSPCVHGCAAGLLYGMSCWDSAQVLRCAENYLYGSGGKMKQTGLFLRGLFLSAWDFLFAEKGLMTGLNNVLRQLDEEEFMKVLPDLRLAFSTFTPSQTDRLAREAGRLLGVTAEQVKKKPVDSRVVSLGQRLDQYARELVEGGRQNAGEA